VDDLLKLMATAQFWLSVVWVGILINLASHFIAKRMETSLSNASSWWRGRSLQRQEKFKAKVRSLRDSPKFESYMRHFEIRARILGLESLAISGALFAAAPAYFPEGIARWIATFAAVVLLVLGLAVQAITEQVADQLNAVHFPK
jgi:hypothetical protein